MNDIVTIFGGDPRPFMRAAQEVRSNVGSLKADLQSVAQANPLANLGGSLMGQARSFVPALSAIAGVGGSIAAFRSMGEDVKRFRNESEQLNVSTDMVQRLEKVAGSAGKDFGVVSTGFAKMEKAIAEASRGDLQQKKLFENLKLDPRELMLDTTEGQFRQIARAIESIESPAARTLALMELFGRSGKELDPILKAVASGKDMQRNVVSGTAVSAIGQAWGGIKKLGSETWTGFTEMFGLALHDLFGLGKSMQELTAEAKTRNQAEREATQELMRQTAEMEYQKRLGQRREMLTKRELGAEAAVEDFTDSLRDQVATLETAAGWDRERNRMLKEREDLIDRLARSSHSLEEGEVKRIREETDALIEQLKVLRDREQLKAEASRIQKELHPEREFWKNVKNIQEMEASGLLSPQDARLAMAKEARELARPTRELRAQIGGREEQFRQRMEDLATMVQEGRIAPGLAMEAAAFEASRAAGIPTEPGEGGPGYAGAVQMGTAEGYNAILNAIREANKAQDRAVERERLNQIAQNTLRLVTAAEKPDADLLEVL
jgi:hypothetical protein